MWAFVVFFIAGTSDARAADDVSPLDPRRWALGVFSCLLLILIVVPVPHSLYQAIGIHGPYL